MRTLRLLKDELPRLALCSTTPELKLVESATGYCGNGASNCRTAIVAPLKLATFGINPANGLGVFAVNEVISAWSRYGSVLK